MYGNYILNNNEKQLKKYLDQDKFIDVKIISPNFDLKYYLSDSEIEERINKLIKFSEIDKNKKLFLYGLRELYQENIFLKLKNIKK